MQAPRPGKKGVQHNALKSWGRLWLECLNYHKRVISNEVAVFCKCQGKVWEIKKVDERFVISHQHKKANISSPTLAYLEKKCNMRQGRPSIGWRGSWGTELVWVNKKLFSKLNKKLKKICQSILCCQNPSPRNGETALCSGTSHGSAMGKCTLLCVRRGGRGDLLAAVSSLP